MKQTLKFTLAFVGLLMPLTAAAYVPPDQYVYVDDYGLPPPTARHAQERVDAQNALYAERRQQQTGNYTTTTTPAYPTVISGSGQPGYVVIDPPQNTVIDSTLSASIDDLIASVDDLNGTVSDLKGQVNRPPRPVRPPTWVEPPAPWRPALPSSGAGTWVLAAIGGLAAVWTARKVKALEAA